MGDDVNNGVYRIKMADGASLGDLMEVILHGGSGNGWPVPQTSEIGWVIYANIGKIADVSHDKKRIVCYVDEKMQLSALGIAWTFGERQGKEPDMTWLARLFAE
ncbi:hypothetical protein IJT93_13380 [bacterium]|nr:hypothetical protein [bacterium]